LNTALAPCSETPRLNRSITLSIIGEISGDRCRFRALIVQLQRLIAIRQEAQEILPCAIAGAADYMP
jgi:hypothetical protein